MYYVCRRLAISHIYPTIEERAQNEIDVVFDGTTEPDPVSIDLPQCSIFKYHPTMAIVENREHTQ